MTKSLLFILLLLLFFSYPGVVNANIELTLEQVPSEITITDQFTAKVILSGADPNTPYYIRGAFFAPETTKYFGQTLNDRDIWNKYQEDHQNFYKVQGDGEYLISFQLDSNDTSFSSSAQQLQFKIGRFTQAGSHSWGDTPPVAISILNNSPTPSPTATPTVLTSTPSPTPVIDLITIGSITLSEIYACQSANNSEWIELFNTTNQQIELTDWRLKDNTSTQSISFSESIPPNSYMLVHLPSAILNNSGDSVRLFDNTGQLHDQMTYSHCSSTSSWINLNQTWSQTLNITPGTSNALVIPATTPSPTSKISPTIKASEKLITEQGNESETVQELSDSALFNTPEIYSIPSTHSNMDTNNQYETAVSNQEASPATSGRPIPFAAGYTMLFGGVSHLISAALLYEKIYGNFAIPKI